MAWKVEHGPHMDGAACGCGGLERALLRGVFLRGLPLRHGPAAGQVAVDEVVGAGLVGDEVGLDAPGPGAAHQFGQDVGGVA